MATIKSFTDLEQSKKLAEFLSLESADMRYEYPSIEKDEIQEPMNGFHTSSFNWFKESDSFIYFPCWSLAALIGVLPRVDIEKEICSDESYDYRVKAYIGDGYIGDWYDNLVDACVDMIIHLHELKML